NRGRFLVTRHSRRPTSTAMAPVEDPGREEDPYRYGWRYVKRKLRNGRVDYDQVPLTLEDVLHPAEGVFIVQTYKHDRVCTYLATVFRAGLAGDPAAVVLHDVRIAWDRPRLRPHGPDIAVIFGVREVRDWGTFHVAEEGVRPELIVEVTSPETRSLDLRRKPGHYGRAGVPLYVIADIAAPARSGG